VKRGPGSSAPRFTGQPGKRRLLEALRAQALVAGDVSLASVLLKHGTLRDYPATQVLITQGAPDNDLFLLVSGSVSVRVNGREVAIRNAGTHIGEMALVDALARRSATVLAVEHTIALRVEERNFTNLAAKHPELWRRVASEIAKRLRERNKQIRVPNNRPVLFIGSSNEGLAIAQEIHRNLRAKPVVPRIWSDGVFQASRTAIESLIALAQEADFAVLVLTADDITISRRSKKVSPRDNLIFELGLFMGAIGRERVFILKPHHLDIKIPSDLLGITWIEYAARGPKPLRVRLRAPINQLSRVIAKNGSR
jgi:CRP/FNR family cyclic AMP-dependent transcriptional regulator